MAVAIHLETSQPNNNNDNELNRLSMSSKQLAFDTWLELDDAVADNDDTIPDVGVTPTFS
jgi:hypothetical protein